MALGSYLGGVQLVSPMGHWENTYFMVFLGLSMQIKG
jgi:hypothetical protein